LCGPKSGESNWKEHNMYGPPFAWDPMQEPVSPAAGAHDSPDPGRRQDPYGYVVRDANGQATLVYLYSRDGEAEAMQAKVLTADEARRIAVNVAKLPGL
jgi:hypothetical protein